MPYVKIRHSKMRPETWWELDPETGQHVACSGIREYVWYTKVWEDAYAWCTEYRELSEMKKRAQETQKKKGKWEPTGDGFFKDLPSLEQHLGDCWYDDGTPREVSKLTIQLTGGGASLQLTDPDNRCTAFTNAEDVVAALHLLEEALASDRNPWRPWPKHFGKK